MFHKSSVKPENGKRLGEGSWGRGRSRKKARLKFISTREAPVARLLLFTGRWY